MKKIQRCGYFVVVLFAVCGIWHLGEGFYIYAKALFAQHLLHGAWERTLAGESRARPWSWSDTWPVARLGVDRLGVDQIILAGSSGRSLAFGPGHVDGTALPGGAGSSVISGHRDTHFRFLKDLKEKDLIRVTRPDGGTKHYAVRYLGVHHQSNTDLLDPEDDPQLVLITCYPFYAVSPGGPLRYVVIADETPTGS